jgi:BirA family transcriptional regulator, biotin operon repressor / biotin---[acetyl-CoA-carboxylase] ligase
LPEPSFYATLGMPFIELQSVDSTNNYAFKQLHAGLAQHGATYFAREQVAGKGQRGKTWSAAKNSSLILSIVVDPGPLLLTQQFQLSACVAVSVCEFFSRYAGDPTRIKWPNDLYWQDRKAGGILIENIIGGQKSEVGPSASLRMSRNDQLSTVNFQQSSSWQWAVIGIGINVNQKIFPEELKNPVSLKQITGRDFSPFEMAKELCLVLDKKFNHLITSGFDAIYTSYLSFLYKKDELVKLKKGSRVFETTIKTVSPAGKLIVQQAMEEEFDFGEIEWVIPAAVKGK